MTQRTRWDEYMPAGYVPPDPNEGMRPIKGGFPLDADVDPDVGHSGVWKDDRGIGRAWFFSEMRYHDATHDENAQLDLDIAD